MIKYYRRFVWLLAIVLVGFYQPAQSQSLPDFSTIKVDELSNDQIQSLFRRATALGYSQSDIFELARQQGLSITEINKLNQRLTEAKAQRAAKASSSPVTDDRLREAYNDSLRSFTQRDTDIFGLDFFSRNSAFLTFQPSTNSPTPKNYVLGPGDQVYVDIYGTSEQYYEATVNPDGNLLLENVGPVKLSGLTIEQAKRRLKQKLARFYTDLASDEPSSYLDLSLGQARSIQVSIVGQVELPGTYNLSAFSTVLNSLYVCGGITENGTLREVKLVRNGQLHATMDLYGFLINGASKDNVLLEDNDVIIVGPYSNRISLNGAVKTPGRFEMKEGETLQDLLRYAGGLREDAYNRKINLTRNQNGERVVADVFEEQFGVFTTQTGDEYLVDQVLDRFSNRVIVKGAVFRPGDYAITDKLTVKRLLERAEGLRADAFMQRAYIVRTTEDLNTRTISFDLQDLLNGTIADIVLQREDVLNILSSNELSSEQYVEISGEVNNPGIYPFSEGMDINDLVLMASGYRESATGMRAEITRRISDENDPDYDLSDVIVTDLDRDFDNINKTGLVPFDYVVIRRNPNFQVQQFVAVEGQVNYPGQYGIKDHGERISDLLNRAGGTNPYAYVQGATLIRRTEFYDGVSETEQQRANLEKLRQRLLEPKSLTEAEQFLLNRVETELALLAVSDNGNQQLSDFAKRDRLEEIIQRNSLIGDVQIKQSEAIGINLEAILENPGSRDDLLLEEGDILIIPRRAETVSLRGKLLYPTTVRYEQGRGLKHYINSAGGFDNRAKRGGTYVIYANGKVARTKRFLFFKFYPKPEPGAEIIVPTRPLRPGSGLQEILGITSGLATIAFLISQTNF